MDTKRRLIFGLLILLVAGIPAARAFQKWERPALQPFHGEIQSLLAHPLEKEKLIVASSHQIFEGFPNGPWKNLGRGLGGKIRIRRMVSFQQNPEILFVLTSQGVYELNVKTGQGKAVYKGQNPNEESALSFAVLPEDPEHWFLGTRAGLFESDDAGKTWFRFGYFTASEAIPILAFHAGRLFVGTANRLFLSTDLKNFRPVFSLVSGDEFESLEMEELEALADPSERQPSGEDFFDLAVSQRASSLWIGTKKGVFESRDAGLHWQPLSRTGLKDAVIRHLQYAEKTGQLLAGTDSGIYEYLFGENRWQEIFRGLARPKTFGLAVLGNERPLLWAATGEGLMRYALLPDGIEPQNFLSPFGPEIPLFRKLILLEPTARRLHRAVLRTSNLKNAKIKRWQTESRLAALLPTFSFGKDFSRQANVDLDRGGTADPDKFIRGPDDINKGWDMGAHWDLGDFVWSSDQTAIDSREKLMVELRNDMLAEATRIYYERRRLQMEMVFNPAGSEEEFLDKLVRMDELTALLDAMTGGWFSKELEKIYGQHPEFNGLWERHQSTSAPGTSHE